MDTNRFWANPHSAGSTIWYVYDGEGSTTVADELTKSDAKELRDCLNSYDRLPKTVKYHMASHIAPDGALAILQPAKG